MYLRNLFKIRKQKGWSHQKVAVESDISYNTIVKIERGGIENPKLIPGILPQPFAYC